MIEDELRGRPGQAVEGMEALTTPSQGGVQTAFGALEHAVTMVSADVRAVSETLEALGSALSVVTQGAGMGQEWGNFGLLGLPIMGAIRGVKAAAGQYVKQQTGVPLTTWADFVESSSAQFESYVTQLDTVVRLAQRPRTPLPVDAGDRQAHDDLGALVEVQWQTRAWKQVLGRVAQLGQVVDAILKVDLPADSLARDPGPGETSLGFSSALGRLKEAGSRTLDKSGDLREWILHPFVEVRDRVRQLPAQIQEISREVSLVEVLLDLQIAELRACVGEIPPAEARIVGQRVAASVLLPELSRDLADARSRAQEVEGYVSRLRDAHDAGTVKDGIFAVLSDEYEQALTASRSRLAVLEAQADVWRREGRAVIDGCFEWTERELQVLDARRVAELTDSTEQRALLERERDRLEEAKALVASL
jgi:hypothetical protein